MSVPKFKVALPPDEYEAAHRALNQVGLRIPEAGTMTDRLRLVLNTAAIDADDCMTLMITAAECEGFLAAALLADGLNRVDMTMVLADYKQTRRRENRIAVAEALVDIFKKTQARIRKWRP